MEPTILGFRCGHAFATNSVSFCFNNFVPIFCIRYTDFEGIASAFIEYLNFCVPLDIHTFLLRVFLLVITCMEKCSGGRLISNDSTPTWYYSAIILAVLHRCCDPRRAWTQL